MSICPLTAIARIKEIEAAGPAIAGSVRFDWIFLEEAEHVRNYHSSVS